MLKVSNTGSLTKKSSLQKTLGIGLQNIKDRLAILFGEKSKLSVTESDGKVVAEIKIPIQETKALT